MSHFNIFKFGGNAIPVVPFALHYCLMLTSCFRLDPKLVKNMKEKENVPEVPKAIAQVPKTNADTELVRVV